MLLSLSVLLQQRFLLLHVGLGAACITAALGFAELSARPLPWDRAVPTLGTLVHGPGPAWVSRPQSPPLSTLSRQTALSGDAPSPAGLPTTHLITQRFKQVSCYYFNV